MKEGSYRWLQRELKKRGISASGKKDVLRKRYEEAVAAETTTTTPKDRKKKRDDDENVSDDARKESLPTSVPKKKRAKRAPVVSSSSASKTSDVATTRPVAPRSKRKKVASSDILRAPLTKKAEKYWHGSECPPFDPNVVDEIYANNLRRGDCGPSDVALLEFSQYLERYLWPNFDPESATFEMIMSLILMINRKAVERLPVWTTFETRDAKIFDAFFRRAANAYGSDTMTMRERVAYTRFLIVCFNSLEHPMVRACVAPMVHLRLWHNLSEARRNFELSEVAPALRPHWEAEAKRGAPSADDLEVHFVPSLLDSFLRTLNDDDDETGEEKKKMRLRFCARFVELLIDLLSQLPTRRFLRTLLDDMHFNVRCAMSPLVREGGPLLRKLLERLEYYHFFEIDDHTGEALSDTEMEALHYARVARLQRRIFVRIESDKNSSTALAPLREMAMSHVGGVSTREGVTRHLAELSDEGLEELCALLRMPRPPSSCVSPRQFAVEAVVRRFSKRASRVRQINGHSLYPDDALLWDESRVPPGRYEGDDTVLALPKLNLQFLTIQDYLLRSFRLFRLEAAFEIREDIERAVKHLRPRVDETGRTRFVGWARMAVPLDRDAFRMTKIGAPRLGERKPSSVRAEVAVSLAKFRGEIRAEWAALRQHDVVFLLTIRSATPMASDAKESASFDPSSVVSVRGAEICQVLDEEGVAVNELGGKPDARPGGAVGDTRVLKLKLDPARYHNDDGDVYETFNVLLRRRPKENNFKAVLETIRDLMNTETVNSAVPRWLRDVFLGYGDPAAAAYYSGNPHLPSQLLRLDMRDTFVSAKHVVASFPNVPVRFVGPHKDRTAPPFKLRFVLAAASSLASVEVEPYVLERQGPYPRDRRRSNAVPFTSRQIEAIRSGMNPGLTMVVGPPGTGKTDVAVQIVSNLYHNFPNQRTLLVTHSNQALNDLFEKIAERDVDGRHLLRLGMGQSDLATAGDFSKWGRVEMTMHRRKELLAQVERLAASLGLSNASDVSYTCESAGYFELHHVTSRIERFEIDVSAAKNDDGPTNPNIVADLFPFSAYFADAPRPIFQRASLADDLASARACVRHLTRMFRELREYRAFELLRSSRQRADYMLTKQARVVAMTCTHASLVRRRLIDLDFKFDNIVMEESAQILDVETFVPMLLQRADAQLREGEGGGARLKRVILIGDHNQLPPVVKNRALQRHGHLDQSLFTRLVRLGAPYVELDRQGRARPSIAKLYNWRYARLGDLPAVSNGAYGLANAGFAFDYQFVDIGDLEGRGETQPTPFFYQNLAEAEYAVLMFQYMRLLGYPADRIVILTTYRGQKHLIRDVLRNRCGDEDGSSSFAFGRPSKVTTVDKYQGQQNDYVLLSLVRTLSVGHIRDVRRLVVAMSRARLGLYVLGRRTLFESCYELTRTFSRLLRRPTKLTLVPGEHYPSQRAHGADLPPKGAFAVESLAHMGILVRQMMGRAVEGFRREQQ